MGCRTVFRNNIKHIALRMAWINPLTGSMGHSKVEHLKEAIICRSLPRLNTLKITILKLGKEESTRKERRLLVHAIEELELVCHDQGILFTYEFVLM